VGRLRRNLHLRCPRLFVVFLPYKLSLHPSLTSSPSSPTPLTDVENFFWTTHADRSIDHLLSGDIFESFPPLFAAFVAAPTQGLLVARAAALIQSRKVRGAFVGVLAVAILFELVCAVLTTSANLLVRPSLLLLSPLSDGMIDAGRDDSTSMATTATTPSLHHLISTAHWRPLSGQARSSTSRSPSRSLSA
jgi:hypothetical protein